MIRRTTSLLLASAASAAVLALAGCTPIGSEPPADADATAEPPAPEAEPVVEAGGEPAAEDPGADPSEDPGAQPPAESEPEPAPAAQADSCEWDVPTLVAGVPGSLPTAPQGELSAAIVGSWQHTHFDTGAGFEDLDGKDIRYVFPAEDTLLYCQDVPGVTDQADNRAAITWDGTTLVLPNGTAGYTVTAWDAQTMLWTNHFDGSTYLLQRR